MLITMLLTLATVLLFVAIVSLGAAMIGAILLGVGTLLTQFFRVTVFEATVVTMAAAIGLIAILKGLFPLPETPIEEEEEEPEPEEPRIIIGSLPLPRRRGRKGRR